MSTSRPVLVAAIITAGSGGASPVAAQEQPWQPVEQRVADQTELSKSLRVVEPGLRPPSDFAQVYRVPERDDLFVRVQGGLYAVFPQSVYTRRRGTVQAVVPHNTVIFIGPPTTEALEAWGVTRPKPPPAATERPGLRVDTRVNDRIAEGPVSQRQPPPRPRPQAVIGAGRARRDPPRRGTVVNDATYRAARLRALLRRAAQAEKMSLSHEVTK